MSRRRGKRESILLVIRVVFFVAVLIGAAIVEYRVRSSLDDPTPEGRHDEGWIEYRDERYQ
jgi:hypothetical protein